MTIETRTKEGVIVISLSGCLDKYHAPFIHSQIQKAVAQKTPNIVVNLGSVELVDPIGLSVLLKGKRTVQDFHGDMKLCGLGQGLRSLFEVLHLNFMFEIYPTVEDAIHAFHEAALLNAISVS